MLIRKARTPVLFYRKVRPGYLYALYVRDIKNNSKSNTKNSKLLHSQILQEQYQDSSVLIDAKLGRNQLHDLKRLHPETIEIMEA